MNTDYNCYMVTNSQPDDTEPTESFFGLNDTQQHRLQRALIVGIALGTATGCFLWRYHRTLAGYEDWSGNLIKTTIVLPREEFEESETQIPAEINIKAE